MFNDNIEIFIKKVSESEIILSDDGETIGNLKMSGVDISRSSKRRSYLQKVLSNHGVLVNGDELYIKSNGADFAKRKHSLISAIMNISDMSLSLIHIFAMCNQTNTLVNTANQNTLSLRDGATANTNAILAKLDAIQNQALQDKIASLTAEKATLTAEILSLIHI